MSKRNRECTVRRTRMGPPMLYGGLAVVVLGCAVLVVSSLQSQRAAEVQARNGSIQLVRSGGGSIEGAQASLALSVLGASASVSNVQEQTLFDSWVPHEEGNLVITGIGVDVHQPWRNSLRITEGRNLRPDDYSSTIIGHALARRLGVRLGDFVPLCTHAVCGATIKRPVRVVGIFDDPTPSTEEAFVFVPSVLAQGIRQVDGPDRIVVDVAKGHSGTQVARELQQALDSLGGPFHLEVSIEHDPEIRLLATLRMALRSMLLAGLVALAAAWARQSKWIPARVRSETHRPLQEA